VNCEKCGSGMPDDAKFCPNCGAPARGNKPGPILWENATVKADERRLPAPVVGFASPWKRLVAHVIDDLILATAQILFHTLIFTDEMRLLFSVVCSWLYYALLESSEKQATLGKMALGLRVADESGAAIGFGRATGRYFSKFLSGLLLGIGFIMILFTEKRQGLHDKIAGTVVLAEERPAPKA
jgi:uncharacterized RDD family membrane protein YckC